MTEPGSVASITAGSRLAPAARLGLALGGGGARGLAHIPMLEAVDELGLKPAIMAGTSIGALIGAAYASGLSASEIRRHCRALFRNRTKLVSRLVSRWNGSVSDIWNPETPSLFSAERLLEALLPEAVARQFADLPIPLLVAATDFHSQGPYILDDGPLLPAIAASSALPGLTKPVEIGERVLIDGGFVNPLPYDLLSGAADIIVAIDVSGGPQQTRAHAPTLMEAILGSTQITLRSLIREKLRSGTPDILIRPSIGHYRVLDFFKIDDILADAAPAKDQLKRALEARFTRAAP